MEPDTRSDPDRQLERSGDEFEERLQKVEGRIDEAHSEAGDQRDHTQSIEAAAARGDDEDDDDESGPSAPGEFDDPDADEDDEDEDDE